MKNWLGFRGASLAAVIASGALGSVLIAPAFLQTADAKPIVVDAPAGAPLSFADLIEQVSPAVVSVNVVSERAVAGVGNAEQFFERFRGLPGFEDFLERRRQQDGDSDESPATREARALGSGFFISEDGFVVTNNHVIDGATRIELALSDGTEVEAELVGTDPETDLAVLRVKESDRTFPYVEFANSGDIRVGDWVVALGNPFGLGGTATAGIISADGRDIGSGPYTDFLQIDASINRGNSGGPTFDLHGRVIGVNTAIFSPTGGSVGIGFAIPADLATRVTDQLMTTGRVSRGWLGVSIQDLTDEFSDALGLANVEGAIVSEINPASPALKAGIKRWDVVVSLNGQDITDATTLQRAVGDLLVGSMNEFVVLRDGELRTINVTVGERPANPNALVQPGPDEGVTPEEGSEVGPLGASFDPLDDTSRAALGLKPGEQGLVVTGLTADSPLRAARIRPGMVILEVNGRVVGTVTEFENAINAARQAGREQALMAVRSGRATIFATADITDSE